MEPPLRAGASRTSSTRLRFIFPCGKPIRREPPEAVTDYDDPEEAPEDQKALDEASSIRWFFKALFVQNILEVVAGKEAEVWMVESGIRNRVHSTASRSRKEDEEQDDLFTEDEWPGRKEPPSQSPRHESVCGSPLSVMRASYGRWKG